jgi:hypothetical protein|tara:strand:- start:2537 stop:2779 length:243 start_codon:yes stop_codon:yes gene_type:complete
MSNETVKGMGELHGLLARHLSDILASGEATPAHLNVARQFLRDNNIECMGTNNEDIKGLTEELPFETAESTKADRSIRAN